MRKMINGINRIEIKGWAPVCVEVSYNEYR